MWLIIAWGHDLCCKLRLELTIRSQIAEDDSSLLSCHQLKKSGKRYGKSGKRDLASKSGVFQVIGTVGVYEAKLCFMYTLEGYPCYRGGSCAICAGQAS